MFYIGPKPLIIHTLSGWRRRYDERRLCSYMIGTLSTVQYTESEPNMRRIVIPVGRVFLWFSPAKHALYGAYCENSVVRIRRQRHCLLFDRYIVFKLLCGPTFSAVSHVHTNFRCKGSD